MGAVPVHLRPALALMMFTGLAPKDALRLPRSFVRQGEIATRRAKTGASVFWPAPTALLEVLATAPTMTPPPRAPIPAPAMAEAGFRASWSAVRQRLEVEGRIGSGPTLYGLRHTVAVILRECGADERTIADALGQKTTEMVRHYARGTDRKRKLRGTVASSTQS